jgi:hypothetical protein
MNVDKVQEHGSRTAILASRIPPWRAALAALSIDNLAPEYEGHPLHLGRRAKGTEVTAVHPQAGHLRLRDSLLVNTAHHNPRLS